MPAPRRFRAQAALALLALLAVASSCDSPTGPKPLDPSFLAPGVQRTGTIRSPSDTARYTLDLSEGHDVVLYFMVPGQVLRLEVYDAAGKRVATVWDGNNTRPELRSTSIIRAAGGRYTVLVSAEPTPTPAPSDYQIRVVAESVAPERVPAALPIGTAVREDIGHPADVDSFSVTAPQDRIVNLFLRKTDATRAVITARVYAPSDVYLFKGISAQPGDTVLGAKASGRFTLLAGRTYVIYVSADYGTADTTSAGYELELPPIDSAPEHHAAALTPGDTVSESIDVAGDYDVFTLTGTPGAKYNVFLDAGGSAPHQVSAVVGLTGQYNDPGVTAAPGSGPLGANATGTFALPASGKVTVTVTDASDLGGEFVGPYRLLVYRIDPAAEGVSAQLPLDQTVASQLEMLGDVDEFKLTLQSDTIVNLVVHATGTGNHPLTFTLLGARDSVIGQRTLGRPPYPGYPPELVDSTGFGEIQLPAGSYTVRVEADSRAGGFTGGYQLLARTVRSAPESRSATVAVGDTVRGESIDFPGDVDRFHLALSAGDAFYVEFLDSTAQKVPLAAYMTDPSTYFRGGGGMIVAPRDGSYDFEVRGATRGQSLAEAGPYAFRIVRITSAPEDRAAQIAIGDTVRSRIDVAGDVDDFLLSAPAGTTVSGTMQWGGADRPNVWLEFRDPATDATLDSAHINHETLGHAVVPGSGTLRVRVHEVYSPCSVFNGCWGPFGSGPYAFVLRTIDRAPETRSALYTVGDTVSGEAIDPAADVDEYTFTATQGDTVDVFFQTPMGTWGLGGLKISLIDLTTGALLGTVSSAGPTAHLEDIAIPRVVLPSTGSYQIRVEGYDSREGKGQYRFRVAR